MNMTILSDKLAAMFSDHPELEDLYTLRNLFAQATILISYNPLITLEELSSKLEISNFSTEKLYSIINTILHGEAN